MSFQSPNPYGPAELASFKEIPAHKNAEYQRPPIVQVQDAVNGVRDVVLRALKVHERLVGPYPSLEVGKQPAEIYPNDPDVLGALHKIVVELERLERELRTSTEYVADRFGFGDAPVPR